MSHKDKTILVVDDEPSVVDTIKIILADYHVECFTSVESAKAYLNTGKFADLMILDFHVNKSNGLQFYKTEIIGKKRKLPCILISAFYDQKQNKDRVDEINSLFVESFQKPFDVLELKEFIGKFLSTS